MPQLLHLLIVDRDCRRGLVQMHGRRWLLPIAACSARARGTAILRSWLSAHAIDGDVVGQWRGRVSADARACDWLLIVTAGHAGPAPAGSSWRPLAELRTSPSLVEYQSWALSGLRVEPLGVPGPFGQPSWLEHATRWAADRSGLEIVGHPLCYRASPYEVVVGFEAGGGRLYFKGISTDTATDAAALVALHGASKVAPESFARSIALEAAAEGTLWWLMEACPGEPLVSATSAEAAVRVAEDAARLQRRLNEGLAAHSALVLDHGRLRERALDLLAPCDAGAAERAVVKAFECAASLPAGWTPLDLDPANVFVRGSEIRYIDLDLRVAPMPLALSIFARRLDGTLTGDLRRSYSRALGESVPWRAVDAAAVIVEAMLDLERFERLAARGDVSGPSDVLRKNVRSRLAAAAGASIEAAEERG